MLADAHYPPNYFFSPTHPITIAMVGVGGNGSLLLARLARLDHALVQMGHPGLHVTVFDGDTVQPSNVGRQLFAPLDVGENKAVCAVTKINMTFGLAWKAVPEHIRANDSGLRANILITCVDGAEFRLQLAKQLERPYSGLYPYRKQWYWLDLGNGKYFGQFVLGSLFKEDGRGVGESEVGRLKNIVDMFPDILNMENEREQGRGCSYAEKLQEQSLFINDVLTASTVHCLYELLVNKKLVYHGAFVNLETGTTNPIPVRVKDLARKES